MVLRMPTMRIRLMVVRDGRRRSREVTINSPRDVFDLLRPELWGLDREVLWRLDLNARNDVLDFEVVSIGTATASLVHAREVFRAAITVGACGVILAHNHPSGDENPSPDDRETTRRIKAAGDLLGIPLLDHVIIGGAKFFSFRERGLL
jgi:DNA repair protein RadC